MCNTIIYEEVIHGYLADHAKNIVQFDAVEKMVDRNNTS